MSSINTSKQLIEENNTNSALNRDLAENSAQSVDSIQIQSQPFEWFSQNNTNDRQNNYLESIVNNYNRICCQLPQNTSNEWLQSFYELMRSEWTRLQTYYVRQDSKWTLNCVTAEELAKAGFFFLNDDRVQCAFCRGVISRWQRGDQPIEEHARHFPRCPFIMEEDVGNIAIGLDPIRGPKERIGHDVCGNTSQTQMIDPVLNSIVSNSNAPLDVNEYGVQPHRGPKNPIYMSIDSRRLSYQRDNWDPSVPVSTDKLAKAGFFSIGVSDYVKCFYCDGGLCDWELGDDPWVEHSKWFPDCQFVRLNKSQAFVDESRAQPMSEELGRNIEETSNSDEEYNSLPSSQSSISSTTSSLSTCSSSPIESPEVLSSIESFTHLEDNRLLCKICLDREIGVVFLPCGHQLACTQCAPCISDCPVCRQVIRGTVRTFFS